MEAKTPYNDLKGQVSADISDLTTRTNNLNQLANSFGINTERYEAIGIRHFGVTDFLTYIIALDNQKSTDESKHIVEIEIDCDDPNLIFKNIEFIAINSFKQEYMNSKINETISLNDD